ncbi:MAG: phosphonoacetaldehyde hydrolase [Planctomycetaceae bacterium]|nr:phosphonoacetaldehyde hydrolase [Planctomycetaceae bacterium]
MTLSRGTISAVILDWAGTTIDYGSRAPTQVFVEIFQRRGVEITVAEARGPMGRSKRDHIAAVAALPRIAAQWSDRYGRTPSDGDVDAMYHDFLPLQKSTLAAGSDVIPGVPEAIAQLRHKGIRIGSTTGYTRELMEVVAPLAAAQGYAPEVLVCSDDVPAGRPAPWMNFLAAQQLGVYPMSSIVVVDDTPIGIGAGLNAGAITVAVTQTGNALGLSEREVAALTERERRARTATIEQEFLAMGAHYVVSSVSELGSLIEQITQQ